MKALFLAKPGFRILGNKDPDIANLIEILRGFSIVYTSGDLYDDCVKCNIHAFRLDLTKDEGDGTWSNEYVENINKMVSFAVDNIVDVYITAGGDGTVSYVASSTIVNSRNKTFRPLFIGFPAGTANAGPIVKRLGTGDISKLKMTKIDAIEVTDGENVIGYGFNDVIIGNSFLGTINGEMKNLDAVAMAQRGEAKVVSPGTDITSDKFKASMDGEVLDIRHDVKQICISTLQFDRFNMRAVFGGVLNAVGFEHPAAVAFMDRIIVDSDPVSWNYRGASSTSHVCFNENDVLKISGFGPDAQIIIDGNPFIRQTDELSFRIVPWVCTALWDMDNK